MCGSARASRAPSAKFLHQLAPPCAPRPCSDGNGTCAACAALAQAVHEHAVLVPGKEVGAAWPRARGQSTSGQQARRHSYCVLLRFK